MKYEKTTSELIEILKKKPEIDFMIEYHKETLLACGDKVKAIEKGIKWGKKSSSWSFVFGVLPVFIISRLTAYDIACMKIDKKDTQHEIVRKKEYFEMWLEKSAEYDNHFKFLSAECKLHYDWLYKKAEEVAEEDFKLKDKMVKYVNKEDDMTHKVLFYTHIKNAVENSYAKKGKKLVLGVN